MASAPVLMRKTLRGLEPANELSADALRKIALNDVVRVDIKRPRSLAWHRRYWALISLVADNTSYTADDVHCLIKLRCGCAKVIQERDGNTIRVPDSIAFDKMDGVAWAQFWDRVVEYIDAEIIPGIGKDTLAREVADLIGVAA